VHETFFGLEGRPSSLSPDAGISRLSVTHLEGLSLLGCGMKCRKGFLLLTGPAGAARNVLLRAAPQRADAES
jgi:type II secretory pathway predicted ATPase ExeA